MAAGVSRSGWVTLLQIIFIIAFIRTVIFMRKDVILV